MFRASHVQQYLVVRIEREEMLIREGVPPANDARLALLHAAVEKTRHATRKNDVLRLLSNLLVRQSGIIVEVLQAVKDGSVTKWATFRPRSVAALLADLPVQDMRPLLERHQASGHDTVYLENLFAVLGAVSSART